MLYAERYYPCAANKNSHLVRACRSHVLSIKPAHVVASAVRGFHVYHTVWTPSISGKSWLPHENAETHTTVSLLLLFNNQQDDACYSTLHVMSLGEGRALAREPHISRKGAKSGGVAACSRDYGSILALDTLYSCHQPDPKTGVFSVNHPRLYI